MNIYKRNSGIALVLVVGVLSILAMVSVGFSAFSRLELQATRNYVNQFRAELIAEAGISRAIEELKYGTMGSNGTGGAKNDPCDTTGESWFYNGNNTEPGNENTVDLADAKYPSFDNLDGEVGNGISYKFSEDITCKLKVIDCASLININTPLPDSAAEAELVQILDNLGLSQAEAQALIVCRKSLPDKIFRSKEEIKLTAGIAQGKYNALKNFITLYGDEDDGIFYLNKSGKTPVAGHTRKVFVNVNTAPKEVLKAVLGPMISGDEDDLADKIVSRRNLNPFDGKDPDVNVNNFLSARGEFQRFLATIISGADLDNLLIFTDPNRYDPLDSTTRSPTTYFCFDSGGCYEIEALGEYRGAKKRITKTVRIYRKIYETTKAEFDSFTNYGRCTTRDDFPLNLSVCYPGLYPASAYDSTKARIVKNAVKPGFWDDFSDAAMSSAVWLKVKGNYAISGGKLVTTGTNYWPIIRLGTGLEWRLSDFSAIMYIEDEVDGSKSRSGLPLRSIPENWEDSEVPVPPAPPPNPDPAYSQGMWYWHGPIYQKAMNVGHLLFRSQGASAEATLYISILQNESGWFNVGNYVYFKPEMAALSNKLILDCVNNNKSVDCSYQPNKTFHLVVKGNTATADAYWGAAPLNISHSWASLPGEGPICLYGSNNRPNIDNVRVIPKQAVYTSNILDPTETLAWDTIEWGTISAGTTLSSNAVGGYAAGYTERIYVTTGFTAGEDMSISPGPEVVHPAGALQAGGGYIDSSTNPSITYRAYFYSGYNDTATNYEEIPVLEDVTITYMPKTVVLSQSNN